MKTYFCSFVLPFVNGFYSFNFVNMIIFGIWGTKNWFEYLHSNSVSGYFSKTF